MKVESALNEQLSKIDPPSATIAGRLAGHIENVDYASIPAETVGVAKQLMLDTLAVAWAGSDAPGCREVRDLMDEEGGRAESSVWAYGGRLPAPAAAFVNSTMAAALDYDSLHEGVHVDISVLPAALAVAERRHASGRDFLAAYIAGCDLVSRLGVASLEPRRGWWDTPLYGPFGACAAAGKLLGLTATQLRHALGIAYAQTGFTLQHNLERGLTKRLGAAFATRSGVFSALLAGRGITAPSESFEGQFGLYRQYQEGDPRRLFDGLGSRFDLGATSIKKFPSCACNHTAIESTLQFVREHDLTPEDIESVEVAISPYMNTLVGSPFDPAENPQVTAQFSIQYSIACAILRRGLGIADIQPVAVFDPAIRTLTERIRVVIDERSDSRRVSEVVITTRRHGVLRRLREHAPGSPEAPLSDADLLQKVHDCTALGAHPMSRERADSMVQRVMSIERIDDMNTFFDSA